MAEEPQKRGITKSFLFLAIAITALISFVAGTRGQEILAAAGSVFGIEVQTGTLDLSTLQTTYQKLQANFDGELNTEALIEGANRGLVEAVNDPYTVYMNPEEAAEFSNDLSGNIGGGIGAEIGLREEQVTIVRVLDNNPAKRAGVEAGDVVLAVNGETEASESVDETVSRLRGEPDTTVRLTVERDGETKNFTITRQIVNNPSVTSSIQDGIGTITITRFDEETGRLARQAAQKFDDQNVEGVILDLRNNGGGFLTAAQEVAGIWLEDKVVLRERTGGEVTEELKSDGVAILKGVPTVVLVNGGTASASEIVAGALQDYDAATLLGEKTFGKGSVQRVIDLPGGAKLKVTIAKWYTPNDKNISKEGIAPDIKVELSREDVSTGNDVQLQAARRELSQ